VIVDTSVWVDFFCGNDTWQVELLSNRLAADEPIALTDVILTEILPGLVDERSVRRVERRLLAHEVFALQPLADHRHAAALYRRCRRRGSRSAARWTVSSPRSASASGSRRFTLTPTSVTSPHTANSAPSRSEELLPTRVRE
jgi:predicted nucleic acid-binding protein